jgi:hypothetical protein
LRSDGKEDDLCEPVAKTSAPEPDEAPQSSRESQMVSSLSVSTGEAVLSWCLRPASSGQQAHAVLRLRARED